MPKPLRRDFWDWVHIFNDGAKIVLGGAFALVMMLVALPQIIVHSLFGEPDDSRRS